MYALSLFFAIGVAAALVEVTGSVLGLNLVNSIVISLAGTIGPLILLEKTAGPVYWMAYKDRILGWHLGGCLSVAIVASLFFFRHLENKEALGVFIFIAGASGFFVAVIISAILSALKEPESGGGKPEQKPDTRLVTPAAMRNEDAAAFRFDSARFKGGGR